MQLTAFLIKFRRKLSQVTVLLFNKLMHVYCVHE